MSLTLEIDEGDLRRAIASFLPTTSSDQPDDTAAELLDLSRQLRDEARALRDNESDDDDDDDIVQPSEPADDIVEPPPLTGSAARIAEIASHSSNERASADPGDPAELEPRYNLLRTNQPFINRRLNRRPLTERQERALRVLIAYPDHEAYHYRDDWARDAGMSDTELGAVLGRLGDKLGHRCQDDPYAIEVGATISLSVALEFYQEHERARWQYRIQPRFRVWWESTHPQAD
jgi:hypothetical protein